MIQNPALGSISTLAPREGSDLTYAKGRRRARDFNPRSPRGERQGQWCRQGDSWEFQPSLPARGATARQILCLSPGPDFNPRSPRGERRHNTGLLSLEPHFNPRSPRGERRYSSKYCRFSEKFQPSLPARGATSFILWEVVLAIFQPSLPARGATTRP